jgi:hypothetical protein
VKIALFTAALFWVFPHLATAQVAILHIQVIEGEGAVNAPATRSTRPLVVEITDETGKPVAGAAVSFHLPQEGPGGTFPNGLPTDVLLTDVRGRATVHALQLNRVAGRFQIRIVASKEQAHAGTMTFQYIADAKGGAAATPKSSRAASRGTLKWVALGALAAVAAAAGALAAGKGGSAASATPTPAAPSVTTIGVPSLTVGKP